jgi:hypothetical protein
MFILKCQILQFSLSLLFKNEILIFFNLKIFRKMSLQVEEQSMEVEDIGLNEIRLKIEALEAKNQMLDGKLENMQLKAQILVLEAAKQKKQQEILKHFEEIAFQMAEFEKKLASLESKNDAIGQICKDAVASFEGESRVGRGRDELGAQGFFGEFFGKN